MPTPIPTGSGSGAASCRGSSGVSALMRDHPWLPYVLPMAVYLGMTVLEGVLTGEGGVRSAGLYPIVYGVKVAATMAAAWAGRSAWRDLRALPTAGGLVLSIGLGVLVTAFWVRLDGLYPALPFQEERVGFDPDVLAGAARAAFVAVRLFGLAVVVPVIEELFWRSFLLRWLTRPRFTEVPVGRVTPAAGLITSILFALAHPEWLPAFLTGLLWVWLLHRTRSLTAVVVSHAVSNLALGIYVLVTGAWRFW